MKSALTIYIQDIVQYVYGIPIHGDASSLERSSQRGGLVGPQLMWPTNHLLVPQMSFSEELATPKSYPDLKYPPIVFQLADFPEVGIRISKIIENDTPRIAGGNDKVLDMGDREIKIWLLVCSPATVWVERRLTNHCTSGLAMTNRCKGA